jgi:hypothetical protein
MSKCILAVHELSLWNAYFIDCTFRRHEISSIEQFINTKFCQPGILPTWHFVDITFFGNFVSLTFNRLVFCQPGSLVTWQFTNQTFHKPYISLTLHFIDPAFHRPCISMTLAFHQPGISSTWHFINPWNCTHLTFCYFIDPTLCQPRISPDDILSTVQFIWLTMSMSTPFHFYPSPPTNHP